ncbi:hypothetical protein [Streptosporangium sp. NPDC000396]|uniref:hypothetical protein n=1 Tax=Streptosporangium sp. NPDC000396 TaxID=3366185 RepID=UPI0036888318
MSGRAGLSMHRIEPPKTTRVERVLSAAESMCERSFTVATLQRLPVDAVSRLEVLDLIKNVDHATQSTAEFTSVASRNAGQSSGGNHRCREP